MGVYSSSTGNTPLRSAINSAEASDTRKQTLLPRRVITRFATVWPATKLRLEAFGAGVSTPVHGHTVRYPRSVGSVTVHNPSVVMATATLAHIDFIPSSTVRFTRLWSLRRRRRRPCDDRGRVERPN